MRPHGYASGIRWELRSPREEAVMDPEDRDDIRIGVEEARQELESGRAVALDVVQPAAWNELNGVVKGAVRIEPADITERFEELPRDLEIIAYCT